MSMPIAQSPSPRTSAEHRTPQVLVTPARALAAREMPIWFMFVLRQIVDILREATVHPVPFCPPHVSGIAQWRGRVVPVLSLERGLKPDSAESSDGPRRLMAVRTRENPVAAILTVDPGLRLISPPSEARAAGENFGIPPHLIRGVYEWSEGLLIVPHLENILSGKFVIR